MCFFTSRSTHDEVSQPQNHFTVPLKIPFYLNSKMLLTIAGLSVTGARAGVWAFDVNCGSFSFPLISSLPLWRPEKAFGCIVSFVCFKDVRSFSAGREVRPISCWQLRWKEVGETLLIGLRQSTTGERERAQCLARWLYTVSFCVGGGAQTMLSPHTRQHTHTPTSPNSISLHWWNCFSRKCFRGLFSWWAGIS